MRGVWEAVVTFTGNVCIQSVSLRDGKQSHGTAKEGMRALGAGSHGNRAEE